nr:bifunctional lysylphosphatidylglycerol flippase/synthetase MprF [uncultured Lachnoanaerobaculum sp.]
MQKIISFLKKYKNVIKGILFISILILVLIEFSHMRKTVSFSAVKDILSHLSILQILSLLILGILAVSPMMLYDYILTKELGKKISVFKLIENSWTINSLNNLIGFAGIIDLGLRYSYFSEEEEGDKTMQGISKVMPYFMSGLSLLSFISLLLVFSYNTNNTLKTYSFVLSLASLILPVLLFLSTRKNLDYFGNLSIKKILALIGTSLLDWLFVSGFFFYVGRVLGYNVSFVNIIPLYCISICIGIVSMIPGSLGSFDLIMIGGLLHLSLNHNEAASWLLLFRIFYYFIPFFIGLILFIKSMGGQINDKFLGLPGKLSNIISRGMLHFMANFFGFFLMASAILPDEIHNIPIIGKMDPIHGQLLFQFPSFLLGSLFFLLGRFIKRHSAFTKPFSIVLCPISLIYINLGDCSVFGSLYILVFLILLYTERNRLNRKAFFYPLEDRIKDIGYIVSSFIVTVFLLYVSRGNTGGNSLGFQLFHHNGFFSSASIGTHFFNGFFIRFLHLFAYLLIIAFFYIAVESMAKDRHFTFGEKIEKSRYKAFLESFDNTNLNASLAFLGDKLIYYYREDNKDLVAFQFALEDGKAVVMGDPIGRSEYFNKAVSAFIKDAEDKNLIPLFYEISQDITLLLHNFGYDFMKFGETAKVDLTEFGLVGKSGRKFRAITNRGENSGYSFKVEFPPFSNNFLDELKNISDNWLLGRQEKGFSLGYFDRDYLSLAPIACVLDDSGNIQAFANFLVCNNDNESSIDLMRYDPKTEKNGIMDYLFVRIFLYMKENNVRYFDLGMAPLSNVGQYDHSFLNEKLAFLVYSFTNRFYSFGGLRKYKEKFAPFWEARYLSFPKDSNLLFDLLTIYKIDNRQGKKKLKKTG